MLTTLATPAVLGLLAVTFGWIPDATERADGASGDSYEYLVKLSPEDVEALRRGDASSLTSELPADVTPISRVRVYVGQGDAPRRSTEQDLRSPRRIVERSKPKRYEVAKPIAPEWGDAALIGKTSAVSPSASPTAERREAFQNPTGFSELPSEFRNAAERARTGFEQGVNNFQAGTEEALRRTGQELDRLNPYATRPQPSRSAQPRYDYPSGVSPDGSANSSPSRLAPPDYSSPRVAQQQGSAAPLLREPAGSGSRQPGYNYPSPPVQTGSGMQGDGGLAIDEPVFNNFSGPREDSFSPQQRGVTPIPRTRPIDRRSDDGWNDRQRGDEDAEYQRYLARLRRDEEERQRREALLPASTDSGGFAALPTNQSSAPSGDISRNVSERDGRADLDGTGGTNGTGWGLGRGDGSLDTESTAGGSTVQEAGVSRNNDLQTILMVFALFGAGYVWVTHMELRAKYRALLRTSPGGNYSSAA